jgi:hypothetical protein
VKRELRIGLGGGVEGETGSLAGAGIALLTGLVGAGASAFGLLGREQPLPETKAKERSNGLINR